MRSTEPREAAGRGETINLRASHKQKALIDRAAEALGRSRSDFMLETACGKLKRCCWIGATLRSRRMRSNALQPYSIPHLRAI